MGATAALTTKRVTASETLRRPYDINFITIRMGTNAFCVLSVLCGTLERTRIAHLQSWEGYNRKIIVRNVYSRKILIQIVYVRNLKT